MLRPDFETLLPRLAATCQAGRLVPFVGSGMSRRACTDWPGFIAGLEAAAQIAGDPPTAATPRDDLVRRANLAVRTLRGRGPRAFADAVRASLRTPADAVPEVPAQTTALARLGWPLVLTTNYDNCFETAARQRFPDRLFAVVGRGAEDCQRVLTSLSTAGRSLLWALQGYLHDAPLPAGPGAAGSQALERQLVVGHEEYRRVTYAEPHFRRAFAEVFRQRSLLFLGAGLQESYLQELFGEVLEYYGPATRPHYAFIQQGEVDPAFMLARFQIVAVEYPQGEHTRVREWLDRLADEVSLPRRAPLALSFGRVERAGAHWTGVPDLQVVRGPLPDRPIRGECLAVSAGGSEGEFYFSKGIRQLITRWGVDEYMPGRAVPPYLGEFEGRSVFAVRARSEKDERSLAHVYDASLALFDAVAPHFRRIHMQLLATGGEDKRDVPMAKWKVRSYPERFSFVQTVRAWGDWRRKHPRAPCSLEICVVNDAVWLDIASGRIDVLELLACTDLRFFVEAVGADGRLERRLVQTGPQVEIGELVADLQLWAPSWQMKVTPPPGSDEPVFEDLDAPLLPRSLQSLGVVPGSTVHFRFRTAGLDPVPPAPPARSGGARGRAARGRAARGPALRPIRSSPRAARRRRSASRAAARRAARVR